MGCPMGCSLYGYKMLLETLDLEECLARPCLQLSWLGWTGTSLTASHCSAGQSEMSWSGLAQQEVADREAAAAKRTAAAQAGQNAEREARKATHKVC